MLLPGVNIGEVSPPQLQGVEGLEEEAILRASRLIPLGTGPSVGDATGCLGSSCSR